MVMTIRDNLRVCLKDFYFNLICDTDFVSNVSNSLRIQLMN